MELKKQIEIVKDMRLMALAKFIIPFCIAGVAVLLLWLTGPETYTKYATVFSIYSFVPIGGPLAAVVAGLTLDIPGVALISFLIFTDGVLALFLVWNFDYAKKIPGLGKLVEGVEKSGEKAIQKYKWAKRFGFIGVVILVIFPFQWTGSAVGSIVGRLIGMTPLMTLLAVVLGTFIRSTLIVYFSWLVTLLVKPFF